MTKIIHIIFFFIIASMLRAENHITLNKHENRYLIGKYIQFLHDKDQKLGFAEVSSQEYSSKFVQSTEIVPNMGMGKTTYWLKFTIDNQSEKRKKWVIEIKFFRIKNITLYYKEHGKVLKKQSGYSHLNKKEIIHPTHVINISTPRKTTYYLRIQNTGPFFFPIILWEENELVKNQANEYTLSFFYIGIILALALYNIFLFIILKDICYLYYVSYVLSISLLFMCTKGFIFSFLPHISADLIYSSSIVFGSLTIIFLASFSINFLNIPKTNYSYKIINTIRISNILLMPLSFVHHHFVLIFFFIVGITNIIAIVVASFQSLVKGYQPARYFLYSWCALLLLFLQMLLQRFGIIGHYLTNYGFLFSIVVQFGIVWDAVFLAVSLADRFNTVTKEKENAQQETLQLKNTINEQLEKKVQQRTLELRDTNQTLKKEIEQHKKTEKALKKATQIKSDFLATMSHEIRTPMNTILGIAQLINNTTLDNKQQNYVNSLNYSSQHLLSLINDILDFSKLESGKFDLTLQTFEIRKFLQETIHIFDIKIEEKGLTLFCNVSEEIPQHLIGDNVRLRQVLINLVGNAIKFTEKGSVLLSINVDYIDKNIANIEFNVQDTGIGIPQNKIETLFGSFVQINSSSTKEHQGTGLGLTICQKIVHAMQGKIIVKSTEKEGSLFSFTIPLQIDKTVPSKKQTSQSKQTNKMPLSILLADDSTTNRLIATEFFEHLGQTNIDVVENGEEAVEKAATKKYDIIFIDLHMPIMDGITASKHIHQKGNRPIIILLTADVFTETKNLIEIDDKLNKPIRIQGLKEMLEKWIPQISKNKNSSSS
ncbi:7TM diverse intracellular signaling domain-containing protein [Candidatus Uabimicrobium sp. HlEnr_7]|uniref:hybrid sensor histidine kinase/response regulator n=1 Tax=Candidatus Uabimicrobium helgolandensis TaxID=3095367 RepID=UPI003556E26E